MNTETKHIPGQVGELANSIACAVHGGDLSLDEARALVQSRVASALGQLTDALEDAEFLLRKAGQLAGPMKDSFNRSAAGARAAIAKAKGEAP